jgi:hypothetical protein
MYGALAGALLIGTAGSVFPKLASATVHRLSKANSDLSNIVGTASALVRGRPKGIK